MSVWVLEGFNTDSRYRDDIRHREYTTSKRTADLFNQIPKIQFTDSGHGIVFAASPHSGRKLPTRRMEYVSEQMARLRREAAPQATPRARRLTEDDVRRIVREELEHAKTEATS